MRRVAPLRQGEGEQLARRSLVRVQREGAAGVVGVRQRPRRVRAGLERRLDVARRGGRQAGEGEGGAPEFFARSPPPRASV